MLIVTHAVNAMLASACLVLSVLRATQWRCLPLAKRGRALLSGSPSSSKQQICIMRQDSHLKRNNIPAYDTHADIASLSLRSWLVFL